MNKEELDFIIRLHNVIHKYDLQFGVQDDFTKKVLLENNIIYESYKLKDEKQTDRIDSKGWISINPIVLYKYNFKDKDSSVFRTFTDSDFHSYSCLEVLRQEINDSLRLDPIQLKEFYKEYYKAEVQEKLYCNVGTSESLKNKVAETMYLKITQFIDSL